MVPNGWTAGKVSDVIQSLESGVSVNGEDRQLNPKELGVLKVSAVSYGYFNPIACKAINIEEIPRAKINPKKGQVIVSRSNTPELVGASAYIDKDYSHLFLPDKLWQTIPKPNQNMKWLSYVLALPSSRYYLSDLATGTSSSMKNITQEAFLNLKILIPSIPEQQKIAEILSTWDKAIETTEELISNSQAQKRALMQQLLTGKKRLLDENGKLFNGRWEKATLSKLAVITKGTQRNRNTLTQIGLFAVINGGTDPSGYTSEYNTEANTITISEGGNSCGYIGFQKENFWCGGHCYSLSKVKIHNLFLYQLLKSHEAQIMRLRVGSGLPNIQKKAIESYSLKIPPNHSEQKMIANVLSKADREIELLEKKLEYLKQEKKALMQQLLTGKRRVI